MNLLLLTLIVFHNLLTAPFIFLTPPLEVLLDADNTDDENDFEQHILFNPNKYPTGKNSSMYMQISSSCPKAKIHDKKHQKKKLRQYSWQATPNKLNLTTPFPDCQIHSN